MFVNQFVFCMLAIVVGPSANYAIPDSNPGAILKRKAAFQRALLHHNVSFVRWHEEVIRCETKGSRKLQTMRVYPELTSKSGTFAWVSSSIYEVWELTDRGRRYLETYEDPTVPRILHFE